jgi:hypothetical protein
MTSDRARKKAARAQQAATGQPYMQAWRSVQRQPGAPAEPVQPPPIEPEAHAVHRQQWGDRTHYLVQYQNRYYTWLADASLGAGPMVHRVPTEEAGRQWVDEWQATNILRVPWGEAIAHIFLMDPGAGNHIAYEATVAEVEDLGLWLALRDQTAAGTASFVLEQFPELEPALAAFADRAEEAAGQAERNETLSMPDVLAGVLRHRAATTRTEITGARLGDALRARRAQVAGDHSLSPVLRAAGLDREDLEPVLTGQELTWPSGPVVRPPGSRRPDTPVTRLAEHTVDGHTFTLICYVDSAGTRCVAVEHDGDTAMAQDVAVDEHHLVSQGSWLLSARGAPAVIYGRAHDSVTALYSAGRDGQRTDWPIYDDPRTGERYFAVIVIPETVTDIVAEAPGRSMSLKRYFSMWFNPPGRRLRYVAEPG